MLLRPRRRAAPRRSCSTWDRRWRPVARRRADAGNQEREIGGEVSAVVEIAPAQTPASMVSSPICAIAGQAGSEEAAKRAPGAPGERRADEVEAQPEPRVGSCAAPVSAREQLAALLTRRSSRPSRERRRLATSHRMAMVSSATSALVVVAVGICAYRMPSRAARSESSALAVSGDGRVLIQRRGSPTRGPPVMVSRPCARPLPACRSCAAARRQERRRAREYLRTGKRRHPSPSGRGPGLQRPLPPAAAAGPRLTSRGDPTKRPEAEYAPPAPGEAWARRERSVGDRHRKTNRSRAPARPEPSRSRSWRIHPRSRSRTRIHRCPRPREQWITVRRRTTSRPAGPRAHSRIAAEPDASLAYTIDFYPPPSSTYI